MKKIFVFLIVLIAATSITCKRKKKFLTPTVVMRKWSRSIKTLNYNIYRQCEAYPKTQKAFLEMYKDFYPENLMVIYVDDVDKKTVRKDAAGDKYFQRKVNFEFSDIKRSTKKQQFVVRGTVDFVRFTSGARVKDGWLMASRNMMRIKR